MTKISELPNGLTIVTEKRKDVETVAVSISVKTGGRNEKDHQTGMAHLLEHMMFKGTSKRSYQQIAEEIDFVGGEINAYTSKEETIYYIKVLKEHTELAVDVLCDIVQNSTIPEEELDKERHVVVQEIMRSKDDPADLCWDNLFAVLYPTNPLGKPILGYEESILAYSRQNILDFIEENYVPKNMVVSVAGNIKHKDVVKLLKKYFTKSYPSSFTKSYELPAMTRFLESPVAVETVESLNQVNFVIAMPSASRENVTNLIISQLAASILGGGMSSKLFMEIREKRGLVYSIGASTMEFNDNGFLAIHGGTTPDKIKEVVGVAADIVVNFADTVSERELQKAKNDARSGLLMRQESTKSVMIQNSNHLRYYGKIYTAKEVNKILDSITLEDIKKFIGNLLYGHSVSMSFVGPGEEKDYEDLIDVYVDNLEIE